MLIPSTSPIFYLYLYLYFSQLLGPSPKQSLIRLQFILPSTRLLRSGSSIFNNSSSSHCCCSTATTYRFHLDIHYHYHFQLPFYIYFYFKLWLRWISNGVWFKLILSNSRSVFWES